MHLLNRLIRRTKERLQSVTDSAPFKRLQCRYHGHDFPDFYLSPGVLIHCRRCGGELLGRTAEELEPLSDLDREYLEWRDMEREDQ